MMWVLVTAAVLLHGFAAFVAAGVGEALAHDEEHRAKVGAILVGVLYLAGVMLLISDMIVEAA